jgi:PhnB protein
MKTSLHPHLIVKNAAKAIEFYVSALGAEEIARFADEKLGGQIVHAELSVHGAKLTLAEEARNWSNDAPTSLGGSPVVLTLTVDDARAAGKRMEKHGATVVFPIEDQFYGKREGRLRDPFGHVWVISQDLEALSRDEIQRRVDAFPST